MLTLKNLHSPEGATKKNKRIGRGQGSGRGTQAGKGHKGQKARTGGGIRLGFEGGQMPLYRRLPKQGFKNFDFKVDYAVVSLATLESTYKNGDTVSPQSLIENGILKGANKSLPVKVLCKGTLTKSLNFKDVNFSESAKAAVVKAGGKV